MKKRVDVEGISFRGLRPRDLPVLLDPQKALKRILALAIKETGADSGSVMLLNPNSGFLDIEAAVGLGKKASTLKLALGEGITGYVAGTGKSLRVGDVFEERRYVSLRASIRSEMAVPISIDGQVVGVLNVDSNKTHTFTQEHQDRIERLAIEAAEWLKHGWEIAQLRVRERQWASLVEMGREIHSVTNFDEAFKKITRLAAQLMKAKLCSLSLLTDDGTELVLKCSYGAGKSYQGKPNVPVGESLVGVVIRRCKPLSVLNVQEHEQYRHTDIARREGLVSLLAVPLARDSHILGVLCVYTQQRHRFSNAEIRILSALANLSTVAIERTKIIERMVDMEENLRQGERLSAIGLLAAEIAHEIRNPLTVVQMLFHALRSNLPTDESVTRDLEVISDKMKLMNRIVDQVLTFARSSEPTVDVISPQKLFDDVILLTRHKLLAQGVEMKTSVPDSLPRLKADRAQMEQALLNLVLNAADAMPSGGSLKLSAGSETVDGRSFIFLAVRDTGCGMNKEAVERLFHSFLTSKPHGTGLGLAIVKKIVENHRGKIVVDSKPGKGSQFRMLIPLEEE